MKQRELINGVVWTLAAAVLIAVLVGVQGCRKSAYERVIGREISWWDYFVISSR